MYQIVGINNYSFTGKDGRTVSGTTLHTTYTPKAGVGVAVEKFSLSLEKFPEARSFQVGDTIWVYYNKYGRVEAVQTA